MRNGLPDLDDLPRRALAGLGGGMALLALLAGLGLSRPFLAAGGGLLALPALALLLGRRSGGEGLLVLLLGGVLLLWETAFPFLTLLHLTLWIVLVGTLLPRFLPGRPALWGASVLVFPLYAGLKSLELLPSSDPAPLSLLFPLLILEAGLGGLLLSTSAYRIFRFGRLRIQLLLVFLPIALLPTLTVVGLGGGLERLGWAGPRAPLLLAAGTAVGLLAAWSGSLYLTYHLVRPLQGLAELMTRVAAGDLDVAVRVERDDEIGALALSLNLMVGRLRAQMEALRRREAETRALLEALPDTLFYLDRDGRIGEQVPTQDRADAPFRLRPGRPLEEAFPPHLAAGIRRVLERTFLEDRPQTATVDPEGAEGSSWEVRTVATDDERVLVLLRDVTEQRQVDRLKDRFIAVAGHQLRTPLTSIRAALEMMARAELPEEVRPIFEIAHRNSLRLSRLVNILLDLVYLQTGEMDLNLMLLEVLPLVEEGIQVAEPFADQLGVRIELEARVDPAVRIRVDGERFVQAFAEVLHNAVRFSPEGEAVTVTATLRGDRVRISVADRGPGIPPGLRERVFDRFWQARENLEDPRLQGAGLGLSFTRAVVEAMGGRIDFETEVGRGTTFYLEFPAWTPSRGERGGEE